MLEVALCVALWIGIGALINDGGTDTASASTINWYLLIGWDEIPILVVYQGVIGTFLSIWWRKSGNLGVSATTHAVIDSVRNASGAIP
jgi:membrane protease YdiL (CAAX protease family)